MPLVLLGPMYHCACKVLNNAQYTKLDGQTTGTSIQNPQSMVTAAALNLLIDGGATRNRFAMPPMENPINCVDMTMINWYPKL